MWLMATDAAASASPTRRDPCEDSCGTDDVVIGSPTVSPDCRQVLNRRVRLLVAATISYNVLEAIVAVTAGTIAGSTALIGFGLDSVVEVTSAAVVAWQFTTRDPATRERTALRMIAWAFFGSPPTSPSSRCAPCLDRPRPTTPPSASCSRPCPSRDAVPLPRPAPDRARTRIGDRRRRFQADLLCTYLSAVLLVGLVLNSLFGWSWADPIAGLVIAAVALKEGREAWKGDACCTPRPI